MKSYNPAKSAMFEVVLTPQFFDEYTLDDAHPFECGILTKASGRGWGQKQGKKKRMGRGQKQVVQLFII